MITILIADDEKLERNGIKFLLKREQEELEILEAINGKDAAGILQKKQVDILFSDIKMPYMTGLELAKAARELQPEIEIVIFSGYNDSSYAKEALHYGVVDYVLKPVDPGEFHKTYCSVRDHILEKNTQKGEIARQQDDLGKYFLQNFLYDGKEENGTKAAELLCQDGGQYTHMILAGGEDCFFEVDEEKLLGQLREHMSRQFLYLNVAANESLFLFQERYADYESRLERGKRYVRTGTVVDLQIKKGKIEAKVQGRRKTPYKVEIRISPLNQEHCQNIIEQCSEKIESMEELLAGNFPVAMKELFAGENGLFPKPSEISFGCSCPDWALMCKHVVAALYGVGVRLDENPALFFELRGINMEKFIDVALENRVETMLANAKKPSSRIIDDNVNINQLFGVL